MSALASSPAQGGTLISGDDSGQLLFWAAPTGDAVSGSKVVKLPGSNAPVNCLSLGQGVLAAAFTSGHVRLYDVNKRQLTVEIAAHTRAINALEIHATRPLLLAASEDTFVSVWTIPTAAAPNVQSLMAESPALGLLTGCRFGGGPNQEPFVTSVYDSRSLALMHTP